MKHLLKKEVLGLLLIPIVVGIVPMGINWWRINTPLKVSWGGVATDVKGERAVMNSLSLHLRIHPSKNIIAMVYNTPEEDSRYRQAVAKGTRPYHEWIYEMEYNRQDKTLTKRLFKGNPRPPQPAKVWIWHNVSEDAIHQIAMPMKAMKTLAEIEAYKGGNLSELRKYGATLEEPKTEKSR